jgi:hypothetical protein
VSYAAYVSYVFQKEIKKFQKKESEFPNKPYLCASKSIHKEKE